MGSDRLPSKSVVQQRDKQRGRRSLVTMRTVLVFFPFLVSTFFFFFFSFATDARTSVHLNIRNTCYMAPPTALHRTGAGIARVHHAYSTIVRENHSFSRTLGEKFSRKSNLSFFPFTSFFFSFFFFLSFRVRF